jgi:hypothetical protein
MPDYTRGTKRDTPYFAPVNDVFMYGFYSGLASIPGITASDIQALGLLTQQGANAVANRLMITRANSPAPPRYTKKFPNASVSARASVSTFGAYNAGVAAVAQGWKLSKAARAVGLNPLVGGLGRTATAIAELSSGALYAFPLNRADFANVQNILGLLDAAVINTNAERWRLVSGSKDKPARMSINDGGKKATFCSTDAIGAAQAAGWTLMSGEIIEFPPAAINP